MAFLPFLLAAALSALAVWLTQIQHPARRVFVGLFVLLCPALYCWWIVRYATSIPSHDDFYVFVSYMNIDWPHRLYWLFSPNNEHPVVAARLLAELTNLALGHVNLKFVILASNAMLLGVLALYADELRRNGSPLRYLPALSLALFTPGAWTNMVWATSSGQNYVSYFLAFFAAALFFWGKGVRARVCAMALGVCSSFASAAGILIFPALIGVLVARNAREPSPDKSLRWIAHCVGLLVCMALVGWLHYSGVLYVRTGVGMGLHASVAAAAVNPLTIIHHFVLVLGSLTGEEWSALLLGLIYLALAALVARSQGYRKSPLLFAMMLYFILASAATTFGRAKYGAIQALDPRYRILSLLLLATYLAFGMQMLPRVFQRRTVYFLIVLALSLNFVRSAQDSLPHIRGHREYQITMTANWLIDRSGLDTTEEGRYHADILFGLAVEKGLFEIPQEAIEEAARRKEEETIENAERRMQN